MYILFFFSSRRRHTRCSRDWSSDVCSSDLIDIRDREAIRKAFREVVAIYGGIDILINTAAIFPSSPDGVIQDGQWGTTLDINVTANHRSEEHTSELQSRLHLVCRLLLEKKT